MANFFTISAISQKRHLELVNEKSDDYDSADAYDLSYQEKLLEGDGSSDSPFKNCPLSSFYMVRADRLSHPCALMYVNGSQPIIRGFLFSRIQFFQGKLLKVLKKPR